MKWEGNKKENITVNYRLYFFFFKLSLLLSIHHSVTCIKKKKYMHVTPSFQLLLKLVIYIWQMLNEPLRQQIFS